MPDTGSSARCRCISPVGEKRPLNKTAKEYSRYGSTTHKQVYIYGSLNNAPVELMRSYGMAWGVASVPSTMRAPVAFNFARLRAQSSHRDRRRVS